MVRGTLEQPIPFSMQPTTACDLLLIAWPWGGLRCPSLRAVRLHTSDIEERKRQCQELLPDVAAYDVMVTTYEMMKVHSPRDRRCFISMYGSHRFLMWSLRDQNPVCKHTLVSGIWWRYVVFDEVRLVTMTQLDSGRACFLCKRVVCVRATALSARPRRWPPWLASCTPRTSCS